jgi:O-antigen/teichoic acid export membrane protein
LKLLLVLLVFVFKSFGIFGSWAAATFIALMSSLFLILPRIQRGYRFFPFVDKKEVSNILHFSFFNYLGDLFWNIPGLVLPIIVLNLLGTKSNAFFYMAWTLSAILTMIPGAVSRTLLAEGAYDETKLKYHVQRSFKMIIVLLVPAVILVWFLANKFLLLYGGLYSENAATLLRWLAVATLPLAINVVYFSIKRVQKKMKSVILMAAFTAITVIVTSYMLMPRLGIDGVGIAWLAGQSATAVIVVIWGIRW